MIKAIFIVSLLPIALLSFAQINTDSLNTLWEDAHLPDSVRFEANLRLFDYWNAIADSSQYALLLLNRHETLARENKNYGELANVVYRKGRISIQNNNIPSAESLIDSAYTLWTRFEAHPDFYEDMRKAGVAFNEQNARIEAMKCWQKALEGFRKTGDKRSEATVLANMGIGTGQQGNYPAAIDYFNKSQAIWRELQDTNMSAIVLNSLGNAYQDLDELDFAQKFLAQALELFESADNKLGLGSALSNLGNVYLKQLEYSKALEYYQRSIAIKKETGHTRGIIVSLTNIALVHDRLTQYDSALYYWVLTEDILNENPGFETYRPGIVLGKAGIYLSKGEIAKSKNLALESLELHQSGNDFEGVMSSSQLLARIEKSLGNYESAYDHYETYTAYKDSLQARDNIKKTLQLGYQYEYDQQRFADRVSFVLDKEHYQFQESLKRERIKRTRNMLMLGSVGILLFAGGLWSRLRFTRKAKEAITKEKEISESLLLNILPEEVALELKEKGMAEAKLMDPVSVLFTDFVGFTALSENLTPKELVKDLNYCFSTFDRIIEKYDLEKIKTIGDAYMCAGGLPSPKTSHALDIVKAAIEIRDFVEETKQMKIASNHPYFEIRIGINTGPVVAGIVGVKKFQYDIWGDTVNTASRLESSSHVGKVNISQSTYELLKDESGFSFESRGKLKAKGKGEIEMYFVELIPESA